MKPLKELKFTMEHTDNLIKFIGLDKKTFEIEFVVNFTADEKQLKDVIKKYYNGDKKQYYKELLKISREMSNNK
jgi:hypothetical protein